MNSIFGDLSLAEPQTSASVLLADDFTDQGLLDPLPPSRPLKSEEDPIAVMRKIFIGGQVDEMKERMEMVERQLSALRDTMTQKIQELERTHRAELALAAEKAADGLKAQKENLNQELELCRTNLIASVDDRLRKVAASSVPRSQLAEILRDLSARLQAGATL